MSGVHSFDDVGPNVGRTLLPGGVPLLTEQLAGIRSAAIGIWVRTGSRDEGEAEGGLSHFLEHILFKGTTGRSAFDISYEVERLGGHIDAFTGREATCFHARTLDRDLPVAVGVLSDLISHPLFDPEHVEREKEVVLEEIAGVDDAPEDLIQDLFAETLWPGHPLGRPVLGTRASIRTLTPACIRAYWERRYRPERILITAAGHFDRDELAEQLAAAMDLPATDGAAGPDPEMPLPPFQRTIRREDRDLSQRYLCLGTRGVPYTHPQRPSLLVLATLLGGGASSRLFQSVRERAGLAYSVFTYADAYRDSGVFATNLGVRAEKAEGALSLVADEYRRLTRDGLLDGELEAARNQIVAGLLLGLESTSNRMERLARCEIYRGRYVPVDEQVALIEATTARDVLDRAAEYLDAERTTLVSLGPECEREAGETAPGN